MMVDNLIWAGYMNSYREAAPGTEGVVQFALRLTCEFDAFDTLCLGSEKNFRFDAGNGLADTAMDTHAESNMCRGVARDVETIGIGPLARVTVGGPEFALISLRDILDRG